MKDGGTGLFSYIETPINKRHAMKEASPVEEESKELSSSLKKDFLESHLQSRAVGTPRIGSC